MITGASGRRTSCSVAADQACPTRQGALSYRAAGRERRRRVPRYRVPGRPHSRRTGAVRDRVHERRRARRKIDGDEGAQGREVITGQQIRAARELLGWTPYRLAPRAGIGHTLLRQFEAGARVLEEAGVIFTADGVKLGRNLRGGRVPKQLNADKDG